MTDQHSEHGAWAARDAQAFLHLMTAQVGEYGLGFMDAEGRLTGWTEGAYRLTGFAAGDVLGQHVSLLFTPEDVSRGIPTHELNGARLLGAAEDERLHLRKDGSSFWASGVTLPLREGGLLIGYVKLFRDATHLRLRMATLDNEVQRLTAEHNSRAVFVGTIAHELRNPLQPMHIATRLLSQSPGQVPLGPALKMLDRQLGFLERLVEDLVDMTRVSEGRLAIVPEPVQLQPLLQEAADACLQAATDKGLALLCVLPPVPVIAEVDAGRLHQVVVNLLNNAIKFTPAGGRVSMLANVDETHFLVKVQDTGCGIGPELQPRLFEMFAQAPGAGTRRGQGLGIGLALVKEIVSLHHGTVEAKSEGLGKGSEFIVRIPLVAAPRPPDDAPPAAAAP